MKREELIEELIHLEIDDFSPCEVMYLTKREMFKKIIKRAHYYKNKR